MSPVIKSRKKQFKVGGGMHNLNIPMLSFGLTCDDVLYGIGMAEKEKL